MKVFLSHKTTGLTEKEVMKIRKDALDYLQSKYGEIELIDNYNMEKVDAIYFCPGCVQDGVLLVGV